jgi:IclR family transcriptional regulator, pca regulon regulatory protein
MGYWITMSITPDDSDFVNALARGLGVITCFGRDCEVLTLSEIAAKTGLTRGTARRFLLTLEALGYMRSDGRAFRLAPKTLDLGYAYLSSLPLWQAAQPIMKDVVDELEESCSLGVLDGQDVVYIARIPPRHLSFVPVNLGTRMPAHINAMGQVLLAELSPTELDHYFRKAKLQRITKYTLTNQAAIRKRLALVARDGYALSDQQLQIGRRSIAVPIRSKSGRTEVALNASAEGSRATKHDLIRRFLPVLRRAAAQIAHAV